MELCDQDLQLRPRGSCDAVELDWSGDEEAERFGREVAQSPWSQLWDRRRRQAFWIVLSGEVIGEVDLFDIRRGDRTAELRIGISPAHLGRGYGRRAVLLLLSYAWGHLRLCSVYLRVREQNQRAVRCYRSLGFRARGRLAGNRFPAPVLLMSHGLGEGSVERLPGGSLVDGSRREIASGELAEERL